MSAALGAIALPLVGHAIVLHNQLQHTHHHQLQHTLRHQTLAQIVSTDVVEALVVPLQLHHLRHPEVHHVIAM